MATVVVLGSINMDLVVPVVHFPNAGETVMGQSLTTIPGGKGANQAVAAAKQGAAVAIIGAIGDDSYGNTLHDTLTKARVDVSAVRRVRGSSGLAFIPVAADGENRIVVIPGANRAITVDVLESHQSLIETAAYLVVQLEIPLGTVAAGVEMAKRGNTTVVLNPSPVPPMGLPDSLLAKVDILVLNAREATDLSGEHDPADAAALLRKRGVGTVIVTLGAAGSIVVDAGGMQSVAPFRVKAVDNTAAGDAFVGALVAHLAAGQPMTQAVHYASAAGALAVTRLGAQSSLPSRAAVEALVATEAGRKPQGYRVEWESTFTAPNGETFLIRPILPADAPRLQQMFAELSPESIYRRFFTVRKELTDNEARDLTTVDYQNDFAYVVSPLEAPDHLMGVARFARTDERPQSVEMATIIADAYQGRGIGRHLFRVLAETAKTLGHRWMMVETQTDNHPMIDLAQRAGYQTQTAYDGTFIQIWLKISG
jgi:ribokinase